MLPPPMTTPTSTPRSETSFTSLTRRSIISRLMPKESLPISASPDSLRRMRPYAGWAGALASGCGSAAMALGCRLGHRRHLGREVRLLLLDALAHHQEAV